MDRNPTTPHPVTTDPTTRRAVRRIVPRILSTLGVALSLPACAAETVEYTPMSAAPTPVASLEAVVYLVGDAGADTPGRDSVVSHLGAELGRMDDDHPDVPALVAFLGDNIYERGARDEFRSTDLAHLTAQVGALDPMPDARAVFLPGNHDWAFGAETLEGREAILRQQAWLAEIAGGRDVGFLPPDGCPGPSSVTLADGIGLIFIDTEWLLRRPDGVCGGVDAFYARFRDELTARADERVIIAAHHPMATGGVHDGHVGALEKGPFVYYLGAKAGLSGQDISSGRYTEMLDRMRSAIEASGTKPVAFAAGHDHSLQVIGMGGPGLPLFQLVSGSGSKLDPVRAIGGTRFASGRHGYMRLDFGASATRVIVFGQRTDGGSVSFLFSCELGEGDCPEASLAGSNE